ncbi:MAG: hypothetical protein ABIQ95_03435, partial [Bdellovibrionia bacterium]
TTPRDQHNVCKLINRMLIAIHSLNNIAFQRHCWTTPAKGGTLVKIKTILLRLGVIWIALLSGSACEAQKTAREKANLQYSSDKQTKYKELEPAEGIFSGSMHLIDSDQDFSVLLEVKRIIMIERAPQSQNPSETIEVPKLSGAMTFPALSHLDLRDYGYFHELLGPMGGFLRVMFDFGDYSSLSQNLILPYTVAGYSLGNFGEVSGILHDGHFKGTWFANPFGDVGTFDIVKITSTGKIR